MISPLEFKGFLGQPMTATGFFCGLWIPHGMDTLDSEAPFNVIKKYIETSALYQCAAICGGLGLIET